MTAEQALVLDKEINRLLNNHCIEEVDPTHPSDHPILYSPIFLKGKPNCPNEWRPLINLKPLNRLMSHRHFQMEGLNIVRDLLRPGMWLVKIDISKAFFQLPLASEHQDLVRISHRGRHYRHLVMPQGSSLSPWTWTRIMKPVLKYLRSLGIRLVCYMDDILLLAETRDLCNKHKDLVVTTLDKLGLLRNIEKSILTPTRHIEFLGILLNTVDMTFTVPHKKLHSIQKEAKDLLHKNRTTPRQLASFLGRTNFIGQAMRHSSLFTRALHHLKNHTLRHNPTAWDKYIAIPPAAQANLRFWIHQCHHWDGRPIHITPMTPDAILETDASPTGWGAILRKPQNSQETYGHWTAAESQFSSNQKEITAVHHSIQCLVPPNSSILIRSDNTTTVNYLRNEGGKFPHLTAVATQIIEYCMQHHINMEVEHIPGEENTTADLLSRKRYSHQDWRLNPTSFQHLCHWLNRKPSVDLFASRTNNQVPAYISRFPDPTAIATDAFQQNWSRFPLCYANPPFILLSRVIAKIRRDKATVALIAPVWRSAPWYPDLLRLAQGRILPLPSSNDLFLPASTQHQRPIRAPTWHCAAFLCSNIPGQRKAYHRNNRTSC